MCNGPSVQILNGGLCINSCYLCGMSLSAFVPVALSGQCKYLFVGPIMWWNYCNDECCNVGKFVKMIFQKYRDIEC